MVLALSWRGGSVPEGKPRGSQKHQKGRDKGPQSQRTGPPRRKDKASHKTHQDDDRARTTTKRQASHKTTTTTTERYPTRKAGYPPEEKDKPPARPPGPRQRDFPPRFGVLPFYRQIRGIPVWWFAGRSPSSKVAFWIKHHGAQGLRGPH